MAGSMEGQVAIVTGAGSGIGHASALALAREGAAVVVADVNVEGGERTVAAISSASGTAVFQKADISVEADVKALVERAVDGFGRLDYAHNNAGVQGALGATAECSLEDWERVVAVNLTGTWLCMKYEIAHMAADGGGAIVNTASTFGLVGTVGLPGYVATKHAIVGLTKAAALEYAEAGIRINAVCPGVIDTPLLGTLLNELTGGHPEKAAEQFVAGEPMRRMGKPAEIAEAVLWLCSPAASFVTGIAMPVDGGWTTQ
jgi:NAD(P)-dependent dehydrogenase (short-subunit alcohol dehydrogenase family)